MNQSTFGIKFNELWERKYFSITKWTHAKPTICIFGVIWFSFCYLVKSRCASHSVIAILARNFPKTGSRPNHAGRPKLLCACKHSFGMFPICGALMLLWLCIILDYFESIIFNTTHKQQKEIYDLLVCYQNYECFAACMLVKDLPRSW